MWLFVTTAARYADAVPWEFLRSAVTRGTAVAVVLDRVPPEATAEVRAHLASHADRAGSRRAHRCSSCRRPRRTTRCCRRTSSSRSAAGCTAIAGDSGGARRGRAAHPRRGGAFARRPGCSCWPRLLTPRPRRWSRLRREVDTAYDDGAGARRRGQRRRVTAARRGARPLAGVRRHRRDDARPGVQGRPAARPGDRGGAGQAGARRRTSPRRWSPASRRWCGRPPTTAAERAGTAWRGRPGRRAAARRATTCAAARPELAAATARAVRDWQAGVLELVRSQGQGKRTTARYLAFGVNGLGLMVMIVVFAHTGGLVAGEVAVAGGASALSQKILEAVLGDQAVRSLAEQARTRPAPSGRRAARGRAPPVHRPARGRPASHEAAGAALRAAVQDVEDALDEPTAARAAPSRRPARDARRAGRGGRGARRPGRRPGAARPGARGRRPARGSGCGCPASTRWSPSPGPPAAASPRCSTRCPATTSRRSASAGRRRPRPTPASGASEGAAPLVQWLGVPRRQTAWRHGAGAARGGDRRARRSGAARPARPRLDRRRAPARGRPAGRAGRPAGLGGRPAEVRRPGAARALPAAAGRARSRSRVVVLNQVDTVNPFAAAECAEDLRRLLDDDGLREVTGADHLGAHRRRPRRAARAARRRGLAGAGRATTGWSPTSRRSSTR